MKRSLLLHTVGLILFILSLSACSSFPLDSELMESGISFKLAKFRDKNYENIQYDLFFSIPESKAEPVVGEIEISLLLRNKQPIILDFRGDAHQILFVRLNNKQVNYKTVNEHIYIDPKDIYAGEHTVQIAFTPDDQSLNRREEFLYTLLVPDRARTLFPCFDQPNLKALFTLELEVPLHWSAVSNGLNSNEPIINGDRKTISFQKTEPLSTYLFSFVAGEFEEVPFNRNGRLITIYHRETDALKISQCPEIADQVIDALEWMENYTSIPYPFAKYDLIILPGFQYGGMEHTGATLYNDKRMFLNPQPTLNEQLNRSSLIAHETAHMWFGDYVTMEWFDDVWTKEVFANYFASKIVEPLYPKVNHKLNFMLDYFPSSYSEDRTAGSNPIKQPLDNLHNAGLVYGNIIYDKSPIVLDMLVRKMGENNFQKGIREYLKTYAYGNATWEKLILILDKYITDDLKTWSHIWINEKGMPTIKSAMQNDSIIYTQSDPWGRGINWPQDIKSLKNSGIPIPNTDGKGYGFFQLNEQQVRQCMNILKSSKDEVLRGSLLITLYENLLNHTISPDWYINTMLDYLSEESNPLLFSLTLGYIGNCQHLFHPDITTLENALWKIVTISHMPQYCLQAFRLYRSISESPEAIKRLYNIWKEQQPPVNCNLSETDFINLSYILAIHLPEQADNIINVQLSRISNPDRKQEYRFISPSVSPRKHDRDSVFNSLLIAENRRIEPWASTALSYLNHHLRQQEAIEYIRPALEEIKEVQRTGDIFFPTSWVRSLLSGHTSTEAQKEIDTFFSDNPDYPIMLGNKIKQQADFLYRANH